MGRISWLRLSYGLRREYREGSYAAMDTQWKEIIIKWRLFLLTHLLWVAMPPTGSYDDDDILTEAPLRCSRGGSLPGFAGLGAEIQLGVLSWEI